MHSNSTFRAWHEGILEGTLASNSSATLVTVCTGILQAARSSQELKSWQFHRTSTQVLRNATHKQAKRAVTRVQVPSVPKVFHLIIHTEFHRWTTDRPTTIPPSLPSIPFSSSYYSSIQRSLLLHSGSPWVLESSQAGSVLPVTEGGRLQRLHLQFSYPHFNVQCYVKSFIEIIRQF